MLSKLKRRTHTGGADEYMYKCMHVYTQICVNVCLCIFIRKFAYTCLSISVSHICMYKLIGMCKNVLIQVYIEHSLRVIT